MTLDLVPRSFLSFPSVPFSSFWDDDDWGAVPSAQTGLTIYEDDKKIYIEAPLPGVKPADIEVTHKDGYVWIRGEAKEESKEGGKAKKYYKKSIQSFSYRVAVPGDVDAKKEPEATYKHGVMTVAFAKSEETQPKKVQVKTVAE